MDSFWKNLRAKEQTKTLNDLLDLHVLDYLDEETTAKVEKTHKPTRERLKRCNVKKCVHDIVEGKSDLGKCTGRCQTLINNVMKHHWGGVILYALDRRETDVILAITIEDKTSLSVWLPRPQPATGIKCTTDAVLEVLNLPADSKVLTRTWSDISGDKHLSEYASSIYRLSIDTSEAGVVAGVIRWAVNRKAEYFAKSTDKKELGKLAELFPGLVRNDQSKKAELFSVQKKAVHEVVGAPLRPTRKELADADWDRRLARVQEPTSTESKQETIAYSSTTPPPRMNRVEIQTKCGREYVFPDSGLVMRFHTKKNCRH